MSAATSFDIDALRHGIEARQAPPLAFPVRRHRQDDRSRQGSPPHSPRRFAGRARIESHLHHVWPRNSAHDFAFPVLAGNHLAFTEASRFSDGAHVPSITIAELDGHNMIAHQAAAPAWDG